MKNLRWVILVFAVLACITYAVPQTNFPKLNQRVSDFTNTLGYQEWQKVDSELKSYEEKQRCFTRDRQTRFYGKNRSWLRIGRCLNRRCMFANHSAGNSSSLQSK